MRILMISDVYYPRINGVATSIETFRRDLLAMGHHVQLVAPAYPGTRDDDGVLRIPGRPVPRDPEDRIMLWPALRRRFRALGREPWDVVHVHTPFAAHYAAARFAARHQVPLVITYHTLFEDYVEGYVPAMLTRATRSLARRLSLRQCAQGDAVIVPSAAMAERLGTYGVVRRLLHVLPTGLSATDLVPADGAAFRAMHGLAPDQPVALFAGRVAHEKNIGFLIDALQRVRRAVPNALLLVAGDGPALASLRTRAAERGVAQGVRFLGYVPRGPGLASAYAAANLFVFASRTETQGLVLLEAMAQGTPVLALAEMGTRDILTGCPGAVVGAGRVEEFARQWTELLQDPARRAKLGDGARLAAEAWRSDVLAARLVDLYAALAKQRRTRRRRRAVRFTKGGETSRRGLDRLARPGLRAPS